MHPLMQVLSLVDFISLVVATVLIAFNSEGCFSCHIYCDTRPRFIRYHPKDRHSRPTVGFEPVTQGPLDLCASTLTTAPRGRPSFSKTTKLLYKCIYIVTLQSIFIFHVWFCSLVLILK
jgi:hypothetical protein